MTAARRGEALDRRLSAITRLAPEVVATATLVVETGGPGFTDITRDVARFVLDDRDGACNTSRVSSEHTFGERSRRGHP